VDIAKLKGEVAHERVVRKNKEEYAALAAQVPLETAGTTIFTCCFKNATFQKAICTRIRFSNLITALILHRYCP
jgi:hypothetical protein